MIKECKRPWELNKISLMLFMIVLTGCDTSSNYCYKMIDSEHASKEDIERFLASKNSKTCKGGILYSLIIDKNREATEYALLKGQELDKSLHDDLIGNQWFDLLPKDIDWNFPTGDSKKPYGSLCSPIGASNDTFIKYFAKVSDGSLIDVRGNSCLHLNMNRLNEPFDNQETWKKSVRIIIEKGGDINATNVNGFTPLDLLIDDCRFLKELNYADEPDKLQHYRNACDEAIRFLLRLGAKRG